jgi:ABC-type glycerol-3-phosphate transport system substrate-binding protein
MPGKVYTRRQMLRTVGLAGLGLGALIAGCQPQVVKETVLVEKEKVVEKVVTQAPATAKEVTLRLLTVAGFLPRTQEMVLLYEATHPEVKVEVEGAVGDYTTKIMTLVAGDTIQDVIWTGNGFIEQFVLSDVCPPMNPYAEAMSPNPMDDVWEVMKSVCIWEDGLYMIPWAFDSPQVYYNKTILAEAGVPEPPVGGMTIDEFFELTAACTKDKDGDGEIDQWGTNAAVRWNALFTSWIYGYGGRFYNDDQTKVEINSPECVEAFTAMTDFWTKYKSGVPWGIDLGGDPFQLGKCATTITNRSGCPTFRRLGLDFDVCMPIIFPKKQTTGCGTMGFCITKKGVNRGVGQESWECSVTTVSDSCQKMWAKDYQMVPVIKSLAEDPIWRDLPPPPVNVHVFIEGAKLAYPLPMSKGLDCGSTYIGVQYTAIMEAFDNIVMAGMPVQQAMDEAAKEINDCMAKHTS